MWQRISTAIIAGAAFISIIWLGGAAYFLMLGMLMTIAYWEFCKMTAVPLFRVDGIIGLLYVWSLFFFIAVKGGPPDVSLFNLTVAFLLAWLIWTVISRNKITFGTVGALLAGAIYIGTGFAYMGVTRTIAEGLWVTLFVVFVTWASDSGAYLIGRKWGRHKLWPSVSPNKTIEGAIAAICSASLAGASFAIFVGKPYTFSSAIVLAGIVSLVGQIGDLIESALKRSRAVKDSGDLLPGHGGVLDRFDSLLFTFLFLHVFQLI